MLAACGTHAMLLMFPHTCPVQRPQPANYVCPCLRPLLQASAPHDDHGFWSSYVNQTAEQIAAEFNGIVQRLSARRALVVYCRAGGLMFGLYSFYMFMATQTCRIYSDLWIRCEGLLL